MIDSLFKLGRKIALLGQEVGVYLVGVKFSHSERNDELLEKIIFNLGSNLNAYFRKIN